MDRLELEIRMRKALGTYTNSLVIEMASNVADVAEEYAQSKAENLPISDVMTRLMSKNVIFNEAVSFAECNSSRDFEDTKASFIRGVNWLKGYLESNES